MPLTRQPRWSSPRCSEPQVCQHRWSFRPSLESFSVPRGSVIRDHGEVARHELWCGGLECRDNAGRTHARAAARLPSGAIGSPRHRGGMARSWRASETGSVQALLGDNRSQGLAARLCHPNAIASTWSIKAATDSRRPCQLVPSREMTGKASDDRIPAILFRNSALVGVVDSCPPELFLPSVEISWAALRPETLIAGPKWPEKALASIGNTVEPTRTLPVPMCASLPTCGRFSSSGTTMAYASTTSGLSSSRPI